MNQKVTKPSYVSKGSMNSVSPSTTKATNRDVPLYVKHLNKVNAWEKGQNPWITIEVDNKRTKDNARFTRVRANDLWGDPKFYMKMREKESAS